MPELEDPSTRGLHLPSGDPAAPAVESLRAMAAGGPVQPSAELVSFFDDPVAGASGADTQPRSDLVNVVRLPIRRAGRVAVAVGAALALAALGGVAVAATGGTPDRAPANVKQDDPSDTSSTSEAPETEAPETSEPAEADDQDEQGDDDTQESVEATHTANPTASANHHDGKGADDEHADVNGGGTVDHRAEHSPTAHPTGRGDSSHDQGDGAPKAPKTKSEGGKQGH
ncbi:hypothetical protein SAMN04489867_0199 [Pedococcus dokdonensis]|uniref:Uncharacterized protein n=1 Tax=Pedococcus dokdonensis TaxID=443156 RepID=A0A1H0L5C6_9MICO|nr:hypothetical protein [Pedococcus dokdonensis]SDO63272.1 hypothetical protein SAMN04489867_0199 [Pedococcus dokdonensis]